MGRFVPDQAPAPPSGRFVPDEAPQQAQPRGFVGPTESQAGRVFQSPQAMTAGALNAGDSLLGAATGAGDIAISGARALINKPALTAQSLMHGTFGAINPNDTFRDAYARSQQFGREDIEAGQGVVGSERLRTQRGEELAMQLGEAPGIRHIGQAVDWAGQKVEDVAGPETRDVAESALSLATLRAPRVGTAPFRPKPTAEDIAARSTTGDSVGASAAAVDLSGITPEMRQAIVSGGRGGQGVNREVLSRHAEADSLPVPIRLTRGEATQDPVMISQERNLRGKHPEMVHRMDETNKALGQNLQAVRDEVGQNVFTTNTVEHGDTLIAAYRAKDAAAEAQINSLYKQLRDSFGSGVPIDAGAILKNSTAALHKALLFDHAPPEIMRALTRLAEGRNMTFENFEALRTNLARIQRSSPDGNTKAAAGVIRSELENLPIFPGSGFERMKPIADAARAAARQRFQALEADPAYDAAVNGTVPPDRFVQKFVVGAPRDQLAVMARAFENDPTARQTISVAALDHLRDSSRLDQFYGGNFSADGFSRALQSLDPKANLIFDARTAETLGKLRNVARYTTSQPRGSFVNNSNTLVGSAAKYGGQALEGMTNVAFGGLPVGTWAGNAARAAGSRRLIRSSLQRGAGLTDKQRMLADQLRR